MSFYFAKHSKKKLLGHSKSSILSLQLNKQSTFIKRNSVSTSSVLTPPSIHSKLVTQFRKAKRTFLSINLKGSITIEASIALPIFIFAIISIIYFFNIIYIQTTLQIQLENTARLINSFTCITTAANVNLNDDENSLLEKVLIDSAGTVAIYSLFVTDEIKEFTDNSLIVDGHKGLYFVGSDVTNTDYPMDIILTYEIKMPFISKDIFTFKIEQNCYFKPFNGSRLSHNIILNERFTYVTENGEKFHENKYCSHLGRFTFLENLELLLINYPNIKICSLCGDKNSLVSQPNINSDRATFVYVNIDYDVYHPTEACPSLQRYLIRLPYDEAKKLYKPCNRCVVYTY